MKVILVNGSPHKECVTCVDSTRAIHHAQTQIPIGLSVVKTAVSGFMKEIGILTLRWTERSSVKTA